MRIAVAGGTGTVGRHVVARLAADGHEPVVLSRAAGVDVLTGTGLAPALEGADALVDVLSTATTRRAVAVDFFTRTSARLLGAGGAAGVRHHVCLSIVGIDDVPSGYYRGKVAQERLVEQSDRPTTILRAAQFHDFAGQVLAAQRGPVRVVPRASVRPVAAREVADALVALAVAEPVGRARDLVGPRPEQLLDLARRTARARRLRCAVLGLRLPGRTGRAMRSGVLGGDDAARRGEQSFDAWLAAEAAAP